MKASSICSVLGGLVEARQPVFAWGGPGIGKSAIVSQLADRLGIPLKDVRALLLDPVDLRGLPFLRSDGRSKWATPEFLPQTGSGILFLDELNAAPAMVQASCYQLVLDRRLGEYALPDGWAIIAAGNRDSDRAVTTRMPTPLRNRFVHLEFEVEFSVCRGDSAVSFTNRTTAYGRLYGRLFQRGTGRDSAGSCWRPGCLRRVTPFALGRASR
jgi:hypothetical protein